MNRIIAWKQGGGVRERCCSFKNIRRQDCVFAGELFILLLLCIFHSMSAGRYADFVPINGTFQNYNPVRRFLDGQIPYRDFQDYLGLGHLYFGTFFTFLLGGSYRDSLMAFSFLSFGSLALLSYILGMAVFGKKEVAVTVTNIVLSCLLIQPDFFNTEWTGGMSDMVAALAGALTAGNSARFIRGLILPIICLLLWGGYLCYKRIEQKSLWITKYKESVAYAGIGFLGGSAFTWSNDYGISCWICLIIMSFWVLLSRTKKVTKILKSAAVELAASIVGMFLTVEILTLGNFQKWAAFTFGTGGFQGWYYNGPKSYYVTDVDFSWIMLIQAGICIVYMIWLFREKASVSAMRRYGLPAFCNMVSFCAVNEYKLLSGGQRREVALAILFLTILYEMIRFLSRPDRHRQEEKLAVLISFVLGAAWIISDMKGEFALRYLTGEEGIYVDRMDGSLTSLGEDLVKTDEFLDGEKFFATYASAQEVVSDIYQPSGTDYIIHVLGDAQREDYLNVFRTADFKYAATIKEGYSYWTYWMERANWFWYRDLYENWHPVYANTYEVYWEKNEAADTKSMVEDGFVINVVDADDGIKIIVQAEKSVNGIADVYIDYCVHKKNNRSAKLAFQMFLQVRNTGVIYAEEASHETNFLRPQSKEYIPISVVNGYGEVTLSTAPQRSTYLEINNVDCKRILTCSSDYLEIADISVENQETVLLVDNTLKNRNALTGISAVEVQNQIYKIDSVEEIMKDNEFVVLHINGNINYEENDGNMVRVIRDKNMRNGR